MTPGMMPAMKSLPMEAPMETPYETKRILGGMMTPIIPAAARIATEKDFP